MEYLEIIISAGILLIYSIGSSIAMAVFVNKGFSFSSENPFVCLVEMALPFLLLVAECTGFYLLALLLEKAFGLL